MKTKLNRYYLYGILPAFFIFAGILLVSDFIYASYYMLGFVWPYSYYTPGLKEKLGQRYGRLSFISLSIQAHDYLLKLLDKPSFAPVARLIVPASFVALLSLISFSYSALWVLIGWLHFELFLLMNSRLSLNLIE